MAWAKSQKKWALEVKNELSNELSNGGIERNLDVRLRKDDAMGKWPSNWSTL